MFCGFGGRSETRIDGPWRNDTDSLEAFCSDGRQGRFRRHAWIRRTGGMFLTFDDVRVPVKALADSIS
jgi:hypothetical protein